MTVQQFLYRENFVIVQLLSYWPDIGKPIIQYAHISTKPASRVHTPDTSAQLETVLKKDSYRISCIIAPTLKNA